VEAFSLCTFKRRNLPPRLALVLRERGDSRLLLFSDGSYLNASQWNCYPLTHLDALPVVDRIAMLDESASTFPILCRLVGPTLASDGCVRVMVGADTLCAGRLKLGFGWSGAYEMIPRRFPDEETAVKWTTDSLASAALKTGAQVKVYFDNFDALPFTGAGFKAQLTRDGLLQPEERKEKLSE
jgi:hypothetical protein